MLYMMVLIPQESRQHILIQIPKQISVPPTAFEKVHHKNTLLDLLINPNLMIWCLVRRRKSLQEKGLEQTDCRCTEILHYQGRHYQVYVVRASNS